MQLPCAVSVIVPVFNAEKYLGACLDSLLSQTFTDYEVIVVDDASTDASLAVADSYLARFGGRLKIVTLPANTGSGAAPRNEGLRFSRGEYVFFLDNDDLLLEDALETLYTFAEAHQADVVYMAQGYLLDAGEVTEAAWDKNPPTEAPTLDTEDLTERLEKFLQTGYGWAPWIKFLRRDFLIANRIDFPHVKISEDVLWTFKLLCLARRWLRIPNRLYVHRSLKSSWSQVKRPPAAQIKFWLDPLIEGLAYLDAFLDTQEFFATKQPRRFDVTNFFVKMQLAGMLDALNNLSHAELYEVIRQELGGKHATLLANLFVFMNYYRDKNRR